MSCFRRFLPSVFALAASAADPTIPITDNEWTMPARDYAGTRHSPLNQINTGNAGKLKLAWTFATGLSRGHEAAPLVVRATMYVVTPYPNTLYALDLNKRAPKWRYEPGPAKASQGVACCDVVNTKRFTLFSMSALPVRLFCSGGR